MAFDVLAILVTISYKVINMNENIPIVNIDVCNIQSIDTEYLDKRV